jgi:hypothetical protein
MAIPTNAKKLDQPLDPSDMDLYKAIITQRGVDTAEAFPLLEVGQSVADFTLTLTAEAVAAGLMILHDAGREIVRVNNEVFFWLAVDEAMRALPVFDGAGIILPMELTVWTAPDPARRKQKTITATVAQQ